MRGQKSAEAIVAARTVACSASSRSSDVTVHSAAGACDCGADYTRPVAGSRSRIRSMRGLLSVLAYLAVVSLHAAALQQPAAPGAPADDGQARAQDAIVGSMSGHHMHEMSAHMKLTPQWAERPGDRERANAIVAALRG